MLKTYLVIHEHRFGVDYRKFATEREDLQSLVGCYLDGNVEREPLLKVIIDALEIDFDVDHDESITIDEDNIVAQYIA